MRNLLFLDQLLEHGHWVRYAAQLALEVLVDAEDAVLCDQDPCLLPRETLHVLLGGLGIEAHVLSDLVKCQLRLVIEQVQDAHLVRGNDKLVRLGSSARNPRRQDSRAHAEVPLELLVVIHLLLLIEHVELVHTAVDLLRH